MIACMLASACAHQPLRVAWSDIELGHHTCGPRAELELVLDRTCTLVVKANRETPRRTSIAAADCHAVLAMAANPRSHSPCTVPQPFIAGVAITLDDGHTAYACWNEPLAARMAAIGDKLAPDWRRGAGVPETCDFSDDVLVAP